MSQFPPPQVPGTFGYGAGAPMPRPRTSAAAIASLVLGILGCVPLVTSLLATIFGIVGIRTTRDPNVSGRGMAIAGLVLGLVGIVGWSVFGGAAVMGYLASGPARGVARQFMADMDAGNRQAAAQNSNLSPAVMQSLADHLKSKGPITNMTSTSFYVRTDTSGTSCKVILVAARGQGAETYEIDLVKTGGKWMVQSVLWR